MSDGSSMMRLERLYASRKAQLPEDLPIPTDELCARYERLFTSAVNDVLREMTLLDQTLPHHIRPLRDDMKVVGPAFTVKGMKSMELRDEMRERVTMLESIPAGSVVAWDTDEDDESAQWGEVMTMAARKRGCRGAVVDGGVRDTDRVLSQGFPVFVRYRTSSGMLGRFRIQAYQVPIKIGKVAINPGDLVFGDIDGVIVVPRHLAYEVLLRAEEIVAGESEMKRWIQGGMSASEVVDRGGYF